MKIKSYDEMIWINGQQERVAQTSYIFSNGYIIRKCIAGVYKDLTPVRLEKKVKMRLSQKLDNHISLIADFKTVDDALSYLKDKLNINLKKDIINKIIKKERANA